MYYLFLHNANHNFKNIKCGFYEYSKWIYYEYSSFLNHIISTIVTIFVYFYFLHNADHISNHKNADLMWIQFEYTYKNQQKCGFIFDKK